MNGNIPDDLLYTRTHEWIRVLNNEVTVGITAYAIEQMNKEIVNVELPTVGTQLAQNASFGVIDSVKAAFDLYAPVGGKVVEVNQQILDDPAIVASSPFHEGWMIKIRMESTEDLKSLLSAEDYRGLIRSEGDR
jgi:glycine cleavage system H protein